jgi:hypothetical protein
MEYVGQNGQIELLDDKLVVKRVAFSASSRTASRPTNPSHKETIGRHF